MGRTEGMARAEAHALKAANRIMSGKRKRRKAPCRTYECSAHGCGWRATLPLGGAPETCPQCGAFVW